MKMGENTSASNALEESGSTSLRRKQKGSLKQQSSHEQRFFSSNFRNHGTGRNSLGVISESPPSNSVGFFFASTPPENHGSVWNCLLPELYSLILVFVILFLSDNMK